MTSAAHPLNSTSNSSDLMTIKDATARAHSAVAERAKAVTAGADPAVAAVSLNLAAAVRAADMSHAQVGRAIGVSRVLVTRWCNPLEAAVYNARHEELIRLRCPRLYDELTRRRAVASRPAACLQTGALVAAREAGQLAQVLLEALADGQLTQDEARAIAREAADAEAAYAAIRLRAETEGWRQGRRTEQMGTSVQKTEHLSRVGRLVFGRIQQRPAGHYLDSCSPAVANAIGCARCRVALAEVWRGDPHPIRKAEVRQAKRDVVRAERLGDVVALREAEEQLASKRAAMRRSRRFVWCVRGRAAVGREETRAAALVACLEALRGGHLCLCQGRRAPRTTATLRCDMATVGSACAWSFRVARTWRGDRNFERRLKNRKNAPRLCPICRGSCGR